MAYIDNSQHIAQAEILTALVIDDEAMIRQLIRRTLEPEICRVTEADSGEMGLRIIQRGVPPVDLVLTDIRMPGLTGWDVAEVLVQLRPDIPVGIISGYDHVGASAKLAMHLGARLLVKPFTANALSELTWLLMGDARAMRTRARAQRARAEQARETNVLVRQQHADLRARLDLVTAAWEVHRQIRREPD